MCRYFSGFWQLSPLPSSQWHLILCSSQSLVNVSLRLLQTWRHKTVLLSSCGVGKLVNIVVFTFLLGSSSMPQSSMQRHFALPVSSTKHARPAEHKTFLILKCTLRSSHFFSNEKWFLLLLCAVHSLHFCKGSPIRSDHRCHQKHSSNHPHKYCPLIYQGWNWHIIKRAWLFL